MEKGLIQLYCGDGKGKTTAAVGLSIRAAGHGMHVGIAQFLKSGSSGEFNILQSINNVCIFPFIKPIKFTFNMSEQDRNQAREFYSNLLKQIEAESEGLDLLVLDEALDAVNEKLLDGNELLNFLENRHKGLEVVITGRNPSQKLLDIADYVSEICKIKHPYEKGEKAREGIEW